MSPELSSLVHLTSLELSPTASASLCGSIEATPRLKRLALDSTHCSHLLRSATLTSLTIRAHRVRLPDPCICLLTACRERHISCLPDVVHLHTPAASCSCSVSLSAAHCHPLRR